MDADKIEISQERRALFIASLLMDKAMVMFTQREARELAQLLEEHRDYEKWIYSTAPGSSCPHRLPSRPRDDFPGEHRGPVRSGARER